MFNRLRYLFDKITIRTKPMGNMNQASCGMVLADQIYEKAACKAALSNASGIKVCTGKVLFEYLPTDMAPVVMRRNFDPYDESMSKRALRNWLWDHVIFDNHGYIVAIHDHGDILVVQEGWELEADYFSRLRFADEKKWEEIGRGS